MKKVKSITITTCVVLSSIVMFSASVLAAPAIVNSDSSLKFDDVKLQQTLTSISDKEPSLNIVFYSTNTFSPNTVILPNGNKVNKAVYANDNFIGSIKRPNYISLYYNKDDSNPNKGSFSANVGSDFRTLITTQDISNGIVKPNIGKYLPQDPEAFIPVVAEQVVVQIKAKQQQIEADIENKRLQVIRDVASKQAWDNGVKVVGFGFIIVLIFAIVYYSIKAIVKHLNSSLDEYKKYKELLEQVNISYSKLVELSTYLNGYTGATGDKAEQLLILVNDVNQKYLSIKELPKFINALLNSVTWTCFVSNLKYVDNDLTALVESIYTFLKSIEGLSGTDPLAEVIRLQKLEEETKQYNDLLVQANKSYNGGSDYVEQSQVHILFKAVQNATNLADRQAAAKAYYPVVSKEFELIKQFKQLKQSIKEVANYITNNNNTYYVKPITSVDRTWATNLLIQASNNNDYYYLDTLKSILNELNTFALEYKQQDNQHASINEIKARLINKVNITVPTKFILIRDSLLTQVREVTLTNNYKETEQQLDRLHTKISSLIKDVSDYKSRQAKLSNYSGTRKAELTKQLDNNNYSNFDVLIVNYNDEDERVKRTSYSSSSYNSSPSSYSDNNSSSYSSSSSSSSSWSSSSSDDSSWSSSSSDDSSSSSSSSDDSW